MRAYWLATLLFAAKQSTAWYLPGAAPHDYVYEDKVKILVNTLTPMLAGREDAKLKSLINYEYYNPQFHFCKPDEVQSEPESLGSVLFGDRIYNSPYEVSMLKDNNTCKTLCRTESISVEDSKFINDRIREDYALNWLVDGLPAAEMKREDKTDDIFYDMGFNLGIDDGPYEDRPALHNHYDIVFKYHSPRMNTFRIVGVLVWPFSIGDSQSAPATCDTSGTKVLQLSETETNTVRYSYRITWEESSTPWATRWDNYLHIFNPRIHWFWLINSLFIVILLCVLVSMIVARSVSRDISRYNQLEATDDIQEDWGWKLVHGEVFRTPRRALILSIMVGNGAQLCVMLGVTLVFALFGFLSPSNRGSLASVMMGCWTVFGSVGGYFSSRVYSSLGGTDRQKNAFLTATVLPTAIFIVVFLLNLSLLVAGSSGAVPFSTLLLIVVLWFGISAPLSAIGSYIGFKHGTITHPVRVNQIPRQIPPTPRYLQPWSTALLSGILPFMAAWVEIFFVMRSLFASRAYYAFGFLALTAGVVGLTTATVTILFTYFLLCAEDYRWHWRAFVNGGASAIWLFIYGLYYWASTLRLRSLSGVLLYLGYLSLLCLLDFLVTGAIGFVASYWAVRRLYSAIRID